MGRTYNPKAWPIKYAPPWVQCSAGGAAAAVIAAAALLLAHTLARAMLQSAIPPLPIMQYLIVFCTCLGGIALIISMFAFMMAICLYWLTPAHIRVAYKVRQGLYCQSRGNPLKLQPGELLPKIKCRAVGNGVYDLSVYAGAVTVETIADAASAISSSLNGKYIRYAVTQIDTSVSYDRVIFRVDDVAIDHSLSIADVAQLRQDTPTRLIVQGGTYIDLTTSGSMLVAGKTRSGKTTGVIALLLQVLLAGRDAYGSEVIIIDPKAAELSRLPHVVTLDEDGEAHNILDALKHFADSIKQRQKILNDLSEAKGDAVKWWDADMHPSFLFIDEYVALRAILPPKAAKDDPDYCLATFDGLIKRIVTMGASAGCYVIISIAEASVQEGGLPAMLRSAMSTRILFRPTRAEGLLIWDKTKLDALPERVYGPGDAWFSSTDGVHDAVSCVHFPRMDFAVYAELGRLLREYYGD